MNAKNKTASEKERWQRIRVKGEKRCVWGGGVRCSLEPYHLFEQVSDVGIGVRVGVCDVLSSFCVQ